MTLLSLKLAKLLLFPFRVRHFDIWWKTVSSTIARGYVWYADWLQALFCATLRRHRHISTIGIVILTVFYRHLRY